MIVDDDEDDLLFFREALKQVDSRIQCIEAQNGALGLDKLKEIKHLPQYIFLDLNMPVMNGIDFLTKIRLDFALKNIPVIVYTTSISPQDINATRQLGASYYLPKTAEIGKLPSKLLFTIKMVDSLNFKGAF